MAISMCAPSQAPGIVDFWLGCWCKFKAQTTEIPCVPGFVAGLCEVWQGSLPAVMVHCFALPLTSHNGSCMLRCLQGRIRLGCAELPAAAPHGGGGSPTAEAPALRDSRCTGGSLALKPTTPALCRYGYPVVLGIECTHTRTLYTVVVQQPPTLCQTPLHVQQLALPSG